MRNVTMSIESNVLLIKVDLNAKAELSSSGKSNVIGTTEGNVSVEGHEDIKVGLNVYTRATAAAPAKA